MTFEEYKKWQPSLAAYNQWQYDGDNYEEVGEDRKLQAIMEMVGEAGEVLQIATKARRKDQYISREKIVDELGDTFWGLVGVMNEFNISLEELMDFNYNKLMERYKSV